MHNSIDFTPLYRIAMKISLADLSAIPEAATPINQYKQIRLLLQKHKLDVTDVFNQHDLGILKQIAASPVLDDAINQNKIAIEDMYKKVKSHEAVQLDDEKSTAPTSTVGHIDSFEIQTLYKVMSEKVKNIIDTTKAISGKINAEFAHIPNGSDFRDAQAALAKTSEFIIHELGVTYQSLVNGSKDINDLEPTRPPTATPVATARWLSKSHMLRSAAPETAQASINSVKALVEEWIKNVAQFSEDLKSLSSKHFRSNREPNIDPANSYLTDMLKQTPKQQKENHQQLSSALASINEKVQKKARQYRKKAGETPESAALKGDQDILQEVLSDSMKALKWNLVKVRGDINLAKAELSRIDDLHLNEAPEAKNAPVNIKKVPFDKFYEILTKNMDMAAEYVKQVGEKITEVSAGLTKPTASLQALQQIPTALIQQISDAGKKFSEISGRYKTAAVDTPVENPIQAQEAATQALIQQSQYMFKLFSQLEAWFKKGQDNIAKFHNDSNVSDQDKAHLNELLNPIVEILTFLGNAKTVLEKFPKEIQEQQKSTTQKLMEFVTDVKNKGGDIGKATTDALEYLQTDKPIASAIPAAYNSLVGK
jgi:hypothetical protein